MHLYDLQCPILSGLVSRDGNMTLAAKRFNLAQ